jgi:ribosomal protein L7/L12
MDTTTINHHLEIINERLRRLEAQMALVSEKVGLPFADQSTMVPPDVVELARANKRIEAIKRYRELTNASFEEARDVVYAL